MNLGFITTINSRNRISNLGDFLFCVAPYCKNQKYLNYFINSEKYKIIDNGIAENILISHEEMVELAIKIKANELIIPDTIGNYKITKKMREDFLNGYYNILKENKIKIQSVIQGRNLKEYLNCLKELEEDDRIDVIGVPFRIRYHMSDKVTKEENQALNRIKFLELYQIKKPVHCLGCNLPKEILPLTKLNIRSMDSKLMARYGLNKKIFDLKDKHKPTKKLYINVDMEEEQIEFAIKNINKLRIHMEVKDGKQTENRKN